MPSFELTATGAVGFLLLLGAFGLNLAGRIGRESIQYSLSNAARAALLVVYAWFKDAPIFVALEAVWAAPAVVILMSSRLSREKSNHG